LSQHIIFQGLIELFGSPCASGWFRSQAINNNKRIDAAKRSIASHMTTMNVGAM